MSALTTVEASALLFREADDLDRRHWEEWLGLYTEDAVFWLPAWISEDRHTENPDTELSLIYYAGRVRLQERVWRAKSGLSAASVPLPRTVHGITNVVVADQTSTTAELRSNFTVHQFNPRRKKQDVFFGYYEHGLRKSGDAWQIARKKIILLNDYIPAVLDFYSV